MDYLRHYSKDLGKINESLQIFKSNTALEPYARTLVPQYLYIVSGIIILSLRFENQRTRKTIKMV